MTPPRFDQHRGLGEAVEDFAVEEFVAQRPVEALVIAVLPWRARRDIEGRDADLSEPFLDCRRDKFAAIIRPDIRRRTARNEQIGKSCQHILVFEPTRDDQREALSRFANFIDKHVGNGPREVGSESSCYAELHLVGLTTYRTTVYAQLQTIYVFRNFGSSKEPVKVVRDAARTAPPKNGNKNNAEAADAMLQASFADAIAKILGNRKLGF